MNLETFFAHIGPYLLGTREHADTVQRLYGAAAPQRTADVERLRIYGRFCRIHRNEVLDPTFKYCREVIVRHRGETFWEELVERYFVAHPMHHFELTQNGIHFPGFIARLGEASELPAFLGELGDFEWW